MMLLYRPCINILLEPVKVDIKKHKLKTKLSENWLSVGLRKVFL